MNQSLWYVISMVCYLYFQLTHSLQAWLCNEFGQLRSFPFPLKYIILGLRDVQYFIILEFSISVSGGGVNFGKTNWEAFDSSPGADLKHDQCQQCWVRLQLLSLFTTSRLQGGSLAWVCWVYRCQQEARLHPHQHHVTHTSYTSDSPPLCFHTILTTQMRRRYFRPFSWSDLLIFANSKPFITSKLHFI